MFEEKIVGAIYVFRNRTNGKCYVGQTTRFEDRYKEHIKSIDKPVKSKFARALKKYGEDGFDYFIVYSCVCPLDECKRQLDEQEKHFIEVFDSYKNGYNMTLGGDGTVGYKHSTAVKLKISKAEVGKHLSEETKKKLHDVNKGNHHTEEAKRKMSELRKGKSPWNKGLSKETDKRLSDYAKTRIAHNVSEETRKKISENNKGKPAWNKGLTKETDERVRKYSETRALRTNN